MAISAVRTVYCDGGADGVCPSAAQMTFRFPPSVALRLAVRKGWDATTGILCPSCCVRSVLPGPVVSLIDGMATSTVDRRSQGTIEEEVATSLGVNPRKPGDS